MIIEEEPKDVKLHEWNILPKNASPACTPEPPISGMHKKKKYLAPITWTVSDLSKAGCLLTVPPLSVDFDDEQEMRRVYTLIYDVFRYKNVLTQALNDASFFQIFTKLEESVSHVWLLFYDLYHRSFKKRETSVAALASKLFDSVGLSFAENALWSQRVRLAASVSRLRIKHNALSLDELLPAHLKDEKITEHAKRNPVTCWVNCLKVNDIQELTVNIEKTFDLKMVSDMEKLERSTFKWDRHCPQIMAFHSSMRGKLARSQFVKSHMLIAQDKSFCRGAATFGKILLDLGLTGCVIQTHVNSPRTTAYLATLLTHNEKIKKLMAFSAGKRKPEYENYFTELGVTNIRIFSDRLIDSPPDAAYMEEVVAVFATPPNSYSAVTDPIDLVCSRGGDLTMLEALTESEETKEAKERVISILEEQRKTLRFAMSRPQIQFVLYETHSDLEAENDGMVSKTLKDINRLAKLQHATLLSKTPVSEMPMDEDQTESRINVQITEAGDEGDLTKRLSVDSASSKIIMDSKEKLLENLQVPDTDLFTTPDLPSLCPNEHSCINFRKEGCFLSLIQRKEIIRLDDKYMIQMAENRGLFGSTTTQNTVKSKSSRASRKKHDKDDRKTKSRKKLKETEMKDVSAQTSGESLDEDSDESDELELISPSTSTSRPASRGILDRLTSAHIRQFVSPDFKQKMFDFSVPSIAFNAQLQSSIRIAKFKRKRSRDAEEQSLKSNSIQESSKVSLEKKARRKPAKEKKMTKKEAWARICGPTLNFILRTQKETKSITSRTSTEHYSPPPSPCERFRRRNPDN